MAFQAVEIAGWRHFDIFFIAFIASGRWEAAFLYGKVAERFWAFQVYRVFMSSYLKVSNAKSWPALRILMIQSFKMLKNLTLSLQMMKYPINQCFHIVW